MNKCSTKDNWIANRHIIKCFTSLTIREMQVKIPIRYHYKPIEITKIKKIVIIPYIGKDEKKLFSPYNADENVKWYSHSGK